MFHNETYQMNCPRLVVIADDITGSFDTGVQFFMRGAKVRVAISQRLPQTFENLDVLVVDAETRHASKEETYREVYRIASWALEQGSTYLYIKTDSGLRGHIGTALKAALDASGCLLAAFAPAYPDMDRITSGGQQLIGGVPLQHSVFGQDLFDPVQVSGIRDLLTPVGLKVREYGVNQPFDTQTNEPMVALFDIVENEDFDRVAQHLYNRGQLRVTAGCAAFASRLPRYLGLPDSLRTTPVVTSPLLVLCGSLNPITRAQMEFGEDQGYTRCSLTMKQLLDTDYFDSLQGKRWMDSLQMLIRQGNTILLDTGLKPLSCGELSLGMEDLRVQIASQLGRLMYQLIRLDEQGIYTPMIIGGDTLMGFLQQLDEPNVTLEGEVTHGVVCFSVTVDGQRIRMLSKSGGFGKETLLMDVLSEPTFVR